MRHKRILHYLIFLIYFLIPSLPILIGMIESISDDDYGFDHKDFIFYILCITWTGGPVLFWILVGLLRKSPMAIIHFRCITQTIMYALFILIVWLEAQHSTWAAAWAEVLWIYYPGTMVLTAITDFAVYLKLRKTSDVYRCVKNMKRITIVALALLLFIGVCVRYLTSEKKKVKKIFTGVTGITWQDDFSIVGFKDSHGGLMGQGEFSVVVKVPDNLIATLSSQSYWDTSLRNGPVDARIGFHSSFIYEESPSLTTVSGETEYFGGSDEVRDILTNTNIKWCAKDRGPQEIPWHCGFLLIIEPENARIWLSAWDW